MIRIARPANVPTRLVSHGGPDMTQICALFDGAAQSYSTGPDTLPFKTIIYGHDSVKNALRHAQHEKCCYCEGRFNGLAAGDVEHFRPKAYSQQDAVAPKNYPGYYWLAYTWDNLLFSCQTCNRSHKRNLFPLSNQGHRARKRSDRMAREKPLLIDPSGSDDPRDHIIFQQEIPKGLTKRGRTTIEVLKLDRPALNDLRRERLNQLKRLREIADLLAGDRRRKVVTIVKSARQELLAAMQPDAPFSAMAKDFINPR